MTMTFNESRWPKENAIKVVKGNGVSKLAVFMDPMCVYCKRLSRETLANLMNVTIYCYIWPFLSEESKEIAGCIYSSADKADALVRWMKYDQMPTGMPNEYSEKMIEQNIALADYLGLQGTPAIFLSDGRGPFGAMSAKALAHKIISAEHY